MKIEVGKYYRTRGGVTVGPTVLNPHSTIAKYPFTISFGEGWDSFQTFTEAGRWKTWELSAEDLVEEVTNDRADNPGPALVPGHDSSACSCDSNRTCDVCLAAPVVERPATGVRAWLVFGLAALSRVVRRLCGQSTL